MQWSRYQENIFSAFSSTEENLLVNACPGSGKTTTIKELFIRSTVPTLYLAFNVAIVEEAKKKIPLGPGCDILTLNGLGHRAVMKAFPKVKLNKGKVYDLIDQLFMPKWGRNGAIKKKFQLAKATMLAKCFEPEKIGDLGFIADMLEEYDLEGYSGIVKDVNTLYMASLNNTAVIDFADQLLFPVCYNLPMPQYPLVLGDEVQDFNAIQAKMLQGFDSNTRFIFVGDRHQSIYAFRGAMSNSMDYLGEQFGCRNMPLNLSYRCPKLVVAEAQKYWPLDIEALPEAKQGSVVRSSVEEHSSYVEGDLVLCRNNAPLIKHAYALLKSGIPCQVRGRDIGENIIRYIKKLTEKYSCLDIGDLLGAVQDDTLRNIAIAGRRNDFSKIETLQDKADTVFTFAEGCSSRDIGTLVMSITNLFEQSKGAMLSTVHKAKGLEAERVYILEPMLLHPRKDASAMAIEQAKNVGYVAVTRAKDSLVYL